MKNFYATESAFLSVLLTFNLLSLYQKALQPSAPYRQPATLRMAVFLGGASAHTGGTPMPPDQHRDDTINRTHF